MGFSTDAIHAGVEPEETTGAVMTPIFMTSTYAQEELGKDKGYEYGRTHNYTRAALEKNISTLEKGNYGIAFASGLAATQAVVGLLESGDHVVVSKDIYGGTYRLFEQIISHYGIEFSWISQPETTEFEQAIKENTKLIFIESPTNPMLNLIDIEAVAELGRSHGLLTAVDNTFMSPFFQNPLELGADIVVHSSTKYLNGHSDVIGGIVITNDDELAQQIRFIQNAGGAVPSPFDCWLTLRSTKTLALRMRQHDENALIIAEYLSKSDAVKKVYYPGLETHPQHELAKRQMKGFGGIVSVDFGNTDVAKSFLKNTGIFTLAESLGGVESLLCHPATMTPASMTKENREALGITDSLVRLSVGVEDVEDLIDDIETALSK